MKVSPSLATDLTALEARYRTERALAADPIALVTPYARGLDQEVAAWVAAHLAYGRVAPMMRAIAAVLAPLGPEPARWLRRHKAEAIRKDLTRALEGWVWRFHTREDMVEWLLAWKALDEASQGQGLEPHLVPADGEASDAPLSRLVQQLRRDLPPTRGLRFSLPDPAEGSACKRWRMFLRWMVRPAWPDLGLWTRLHPAGLIIPLDTHVAQVSRRLGLSCRKNPDGRMAHEVTSSLRSLCPEDPLRFDFALSHLGILGDCTGRKDFTSCQPCPLMNSCNCP